MDEEDRRETVADMLGPVLEDGEAYKVYCQDGKVYVEDEGTSVCAVRHPRLYGRLLAFNTQIEQAGGSYTRLPLLLGLTFCVGIELDWWLAGARLKLKSWWFYILVLYALFQLLNAIGNALQRAVYQRGRDDLFALTAQDNLERDLLVGMIEGDPAVERVAHHLRLDTEVPLPRESPRTPEAL